MCLISSNIAIAADFHYGRYSGSSKVYSLNAPRTVLSFRYCGSFETLNNFKIRNRMKVLVVLYNRSVTCFAKYLSDGEAHVHCQITVLFVL